MKITVTPSTNKKLVAVSLQHYGEVVLFQEQRPGQVTMFGKYGYSDPVSSWSSLETILKAFPKEAVPIYEGDSVTIQF